MEADEKRSFPPNPYDHASFAQKLFFLYVMLLGDYELCCSLYNHATGRWPYALVKLGASKPLVNEDLPEVSTLVSGPPEIVERQCTRQ